MVPPVFPGPDLLVTVTGLFEIVGAVGQTLHPLALTRAVRLFGTELLTVRIDLEN